MSRIIVRPVFRNAACRELRVQKGILKICFARAFMTKL